MVKLAEMVEKAAADFVAGDHRSITIIPKVVESINSPILELQAESIGPLNNSVIMESL